MKKVLWVIVTLWAVVFTFPFCCCAEEGEPSVSAKACVLIEQKTGKIVFEKNSGQKLPMASTTKIMTTLICLESGGLDDEFVVDSEAIKVEGSSMGLREGDVVTKRALCCGMLLPSGNDAANAVAVKISGSIPEFAKLMNKRAEQIGMTRTCFVTPSGLEGEGHGSSAYDMALLAREALKNPDFSSICSQSSMKVRFGNPPYDRWLKNTNKLLTMYKGTTGVKTGFTDEAGRCLVSSCNRDGVSLICVTLNDRCDWDDHMKMYDYGFSKLVPRKLSCDDEFTVEVAGSDKACIHAKAAGEVDIGSDGETGGNIRSEVSLPPFVYAGVKTGDKIGELRWYYGDRLIEAVPVTSLEDADFQKSAQEDKSFFERIKDFLFN